MTLSAIYIDALKELINIGVGKGAATLNQLLNTHIILEVPNIHIVNINELDNYFTQSANQKYAFISLPFQGNISGKAKLIFPFSSAIKLASIFVEKEKIAYYEDLNYIRSGILTEVGNIVINSIIGTLSNELKLTLNYKVPTYVEGEVTSIIKSVADNLSTEAIICHTFFRTQDTEVTGELILFFEFGSLETLIVLLNNYINE